MVLLDRTAAQDQIAPRINRIAVAVIFFTNGATIANWIARIPDVKQGLSLSDGTLGFALLWMAVGALIAQPASGWAISRVGSRLVTTVTALLFCLSIILPGISPSLPLLMLSLFIVGACNGALDVAMNAQAALVEGRYARPIMSSFHGLWSIGGLLGAVAGGLAAGRTLPLALHFVTIAIIAFVIMFFATRQLIPDQGSHTSQGASFALPPLILVPMGIVSFCVLVCEGAIGDWSAIYLRDTLGSTPGNAAAGYAVFALMMAIGRLSGDWLTTRLGPALLVRGSGVLVILGISLALLSSNAWLVICGFGLVGAGLACVFPVILSVAAQTPGVAPSTAIAAMATSGYTGFLVGPPLIGFIAESITLRGALGLLVVFGVLIVVLGAAVQHRRPVAPA